MRVLAPAKVNLCLHVVGQRPDGYHLLDSLAMFADFGDSLCLQPGPTVSLTVRGPFSEGVPTDARNLVWRAAELASWTGTITLEKELPHGAGIGGGSSDAAALLRAVGFSGDSLSLGADVPVCQRAVATHMRGIGEVLASVPNAPRLPAVLVNPGCHIATPTVFRALEHKAHPGVPAFPSPDAWIDWLRAQRNDLEAPAVRLAPEIGSVLRALSRDPSCRLARMSGSGSTCFGLYDTLASAQAAARAMQAARPGWWCRATVLS